MTEKEIKDALEEARRHKEEADRLERFAKHHPEERKADDRDLDEARRQRIDAVRDELRADRREASPASEEERKAAEERSLTHHYVARLHRGLSDHHRELGEEGKEERHRDEALRHSIEGHEMNPSRKRVLSGEETGRQERKATDLADRHAGHGVLFDHEKAREELRRLNAE